MKKPKRNAAPSKGATSDDDDDVDTSYGDTRGGKAAAKEPELDDFIKTMREEYEAGYNKDRDNQDQAYQDLRFIAGDNQWDPKALQERTDEDRPVLVVNQCPQFVRQVSGDMRQMKPAIKVVPVDDAASKEVAAKVLPGMIRYIEQRSGAQRIYFQAADQQCGAGIGHWRITHEYAAQRTFNQEIRIEPIPDGISVVWDPDAVMPDRSDAMYCFVPVDMARRKFKKLYPGKTADPLSPSTSPEPWTSWFSDDHVRIAEYFYKQPEKRQLAVYQDGKIDDITDDPESEAFAQQMGAEIEERDGFCVYRALVSANEVIEGPDKWPGPDIPIVPLLGEEVQIGRQVVRRGVIRVLRDVQRIYNYAISTQTEIVALQPKSPFIGTREQFEKYQDQWETANQRNWPYLEYTNVPGVPPPQRSPPAAASPGLDNLMTQMQEAMNSTTGIYPAALGAKSNETSGRAILARQREGDTGTFVYISNFAGALQRTGQIIVNMIPQIYDTARVIQITGEDGKIDQLPINQPSLDQQGAGPGIGLNDVTVGAYEVAIEMGPSFSTKRQEAADGMNELLRTLGPQGAMLFIDLLVKQMDWPLADKIAERAKFMLPPQIQQKEAMESGEPPSPPPPPPPPTPEQQEAMALEQQKLQEEQQKNIELARKNELDQARQQLEIQQLELESVKTQAAIQQEQQKTIALARKNELDDLQQQIEIQKLELETVKLLHDEKVSGLTSDAAMTEEMQKNIELARKLELEDRRQQLELRKIELEAGTLMNGQLSPESMMSEDQQKNIELARKNELEDRRQQLEMRKIELELGRLQHSEADNDRRQELERKKMDLEAVSLAQSELKGARDHELAMNPPPEPVPTEAPMAAEHAELNQRVDALTEVVMELTALVHTLTGVPPPANGGLDLSSMPPPQPPSEPPPPMDPNNPAASGVFAAPQTPPV